MSGVIAALDTLTAAATDVAGLGAAINAANAAAAVSTTRLMAAAGDEVSADIAALFSDHALQYQAVSAEAVAFHGRFVQALTGGVQMYAAAVKVSRAAITPDMSSPYPGQPAIQLQAQLRCPIRGLR